MDIHCPLEPSAASIVDIVRYDMLKLGFGQRRAELVAKMKDELMFEVIEG